MAEHKGTTTERQGDSSNWNVFKTRKRGVAAKMDVMSFINTRRYYSISLAGLDPRVSASKIRERKE